MEEVEGRRGHSSESTGRGAALIFVFDFVDPGSYLVHELLPGIQSHLAPGAVRMLPLELAGPHDEMIRSADPGWATLSASLGELACREGLPFEPPGIVPRTRKAHELALHGIEREVHLHRAVFRAHFGGRDIGRVDVLVEIADEAGLDAPEVRTVLGVDRFGPAVDEARAEARALGVRGVPTLLRGPDGPRLEGFRSIRELREFAGGG